MIGINIKLVRVDSRLLHATVQLNWNQFINADQVWVVSPHYVEDPFIANVMQLCLPKTMKVNFYSVEQLMEQLQMKANTKVIIQLPYPASRVMLKSLTEYFSQEDIKRIRYIQEQNIKLFFQTTPYDNKDYTIFTK